MVFTNNSVTLAMLSFFSTTVDDFCVILVFFAREYVKTNRFSHPDTLVAFLKISIGQVLGFTIIVGISLILGMALHSVVDPEYIDLVGILPILIGVYKVYELLDECGFISRAYHYICCSTEIEIEESVAAKEAAFALDGEKKPLVTLEEGNSNYTDGSNKKLFQKDMGNSELDEDTIQLDSILNEEALESLDSVDQGSYCVVCMKQMLCFLDPLIFEVTMYALMFGTDNIAIYVALFSGVSFFESIAVCIFFYSLLLLYLVIAILIIVQCPLVGKFIGDNANYLVPFILIGLGLFILHDSIIWN